YKAGFKTIDEIGRKRIELAAKNIKSKTYFDIDYGFKLYKLNKPTENTLNNLYNFDPNDYRLLSSDFIIPFEFDGESGKSTILTTWLNKDGYGLLAKPSEYILNDYAADLYKDSLYIIDEGLKSEDLQELIKRIEQDELVISRIVVYAHSLSFDIYHELKNNISNLKNNRSVSLIERY